MPFKKTFVVSDESLNTYGFWVRNAGIELTNAKKNCPAYYMHRTWEIPLGHWENIRLDGSRLLADLIIDGGNDAEREYIRKIENSDIKGSSVGLDPIEWNRDQVNLKEGQTAPTLWRSELFEISLAPLNGNKNALALKSKDGLVTLSDDNKGNLIPDLNTKQNMKQIALKLGLSENASEHEIIAAIATIQLSATNSEAMRQHIEKQANDELSDEGQKKLFTELSKTNFTQALSFLALSKKSEGTVAASTETEKVEKNIKVVDLIKKGKTELSKSSETTDEEKDCYDYLQKHNPLELSRIRNDEPEKYVELAKGYQSGIRYKK